MPLVMVAGMIHTATIIPTGGLTTGAEQRAGYQEKEAGQFTVIPHKCSDMFHVNIRSDFSEGFGASAPSLNTGRLIGPLFTWERSALWPHTDYGTDREIPHTFI
jgi:hypothetical protein